MIDPGFSAADDPASAKSTWVGAHDWSSSPLIHYAGSVSDEQRATTAHLPFAAHLHPGVDDDLGAIDATILRCIDVGRVDNLLVRVKRRGDPFAHQVFRHALNHAIGVATVREIATELGLTERTLQRRCAAIGIPRPKRLISLARVFAVERLAEWSRRRAGAIALALGFSEYSNYRRLKRQLLGEIRGRGDTGHVEDVIIRTLSGSRSHRKR